MWKNTFYRDSNSQREKMVPLFKQISESPKTRSLKGMQDQKDPEDVTELHNRVGCQIWGSANSLFCTKGVAASPKRKVAKGIFQQQILPEKSSHLALHTSRKQQGVDGELLKRAICGQYITTEYE